MPDDADTADAAPPAPDGRNDQPPRPRDEPPAEPSGRLVLADDDVRHVAKLARLAVPDGRIHAYATQLTGILDYVAKIAEVDVENVEPTAHAVDLTNVLRPDRVGPMLPVGQVLQNAPDSDPPFFKVPKVIGGDEDSAG